MNEVQRKKLLDPIKKNNKLEVEKKDHKTKDIIYLKEGIDKLHAFYPNSFSRKGIILVKGIENYENKINYKDQELGYSCKWKQSANKEI